MDKFNHFDYVPSTIQQGTKRSTFKYRRKLATTGCLGFLYPLGKPEFMMPSSTLEIDDFACEVRSQAMVAPLMDELYLDIFAFYTRAADLWEHWEQFLGATDNVLFDNLSEYNIPYINYAVDDSDTTVLDFRCQQMIAIQMELPRTVSESDGVYVKISALPLRNYNFCWNEYFRPEQCIAPVLFSKTDRGNAGDNVGTVINAMTLTAGGNNYSLATPGRITGSDPTTVCDGGAILPVYRAHRSLATSCLPKPSLETLNLLGAINDLPVGFVAAANQTPSSAVNAIAAKANVALEKDKFYQGYSGTTSNPGLVASWKDVELTVNGYRETIMLQNYYDCLNRAGSRYGELLANLFNVNVNPKTLGIPLLITHKRFTIYRNQIEATADSATSNIGAQKGYIDTICRDYFFNYTCEEHSFIQMFWCIRAADIRQADGIDPMWEKFGKFDLYYKQFDGMGDVPFYIRNIVVDDTNGTNRNDYNVIFGYQEYGADEKYQRNSAMGFLDPHCQAPLRGFTLTESIDTSTVALESNLYSYLSCIAECEALMECFAVTSFYVAPQFILDFRLNGKIIKPMPVYNVPGNGALI